MTDYMKQLNEEIVIYKNIKEKLIQFKILLEEIVGDHEDENFRQILQQFLENENIENTLETEFCGDYEYEDIHLNLEFLDKIREEIPEVDLVLTIIHEKDEKRFYVYCNDYEYIYNFVLNKLCILIDESIKLEMDIERKDEII